MTMTSRDFWMSMQLLRDVRAVTTMGNYLEAYNTNPDGEHNLPEALGEIEVAERMLDALARRSGRVSREASALLKKMGQHRLAVRGDLVSAKGRTKKA